MKMEGNGIPEKYHGAERTEEVQDVIDRMPTRFGFWAGGIALLIFGALVGFGFIISYPDVIAGRVVINSSASPVKLVANTSGKIHLTNISSSNTVKNGDVIAFIENAASYEAVQYIDSILQEHNGIAGELRIWKFLRLPQKPSLGELTTLYNDFLYKVYQLHNFYTTKKYDEQISGLYDLQKEQQRGIQNSKQKLKLTGESIRYLKKFLVRDSLLFIENAIPEADLDKTKMELLSSRNTHANVLSSLIQTEKEKVQTANRISELQLLKENEERDLKLAARASLNVLKDNIELWKNKYIIVAPFSGRVQFLKFWTSSQFVQAGQEVFTVVPPQQEPYGQVTIPTPGAGKVKEGQEVIMKLDDYPYLEFGSITGVVESISISTNTERTEQGVMDTYLVTVGFDKGVVTNFGSELDLTQETKGQAEIVVNERRLIARFFDNLKYVLNE